MNTLVKRNGFWPSTSSVDDFLNENLFSWPSEMSRSGTMPRVNISETDEQFMVEMAAPGMKREDFNVELDNDTLIISSEMTRSSEGENDEKSSFTRREFSYESFKRSFYLPNTVEADKIKAKYEDGVLRLIIPKKEEAKRKPPRTIEIS